MANWSAQLEERQKVIQNEIVPTMLGLDRFLGQLNYGEQFYRVQNKSQMSWEFEDKDTKKTFVATLVGEVADAEDGTLLGRKGNYKPLKNQAPGPLTDGTKVKNIIVLRKMTGSNTMAERAFLNQTAPLNKIKLLIDADDETKQQTPTNNGQSAWVVSSAEAIELPGKRPLDLIVISLPKKYTTPVGHVSTSMSEVLTEVRPLSEVEVDEKPSSSTSKEKQKREQIHVGQLFDPTRLPNFSPDSLQFVKDKLVQHDIRDINGELIPAWNIENGLRPGTIVLVTAILHVYNIKNDRGNGFRRYFQIDAERVKVLADALEQSTDEIKKDKPAGTPEQRKVVFDDIALYAEKKRSLGETKEEHTTKKSKTTKVISHAMETD